MLRHWSRSVCWCKRKLMLRLWNCKTKAVTVTRNLVLELKYDPVNKKLNNALPGQAGHWDLHLPDRESYLPRAVLIVIPWVLLKSKFKVYVNHCCCCWWVHVCVWSCLHGEVSLTWAKRTALYNKIRIIYSLYYYCVLIHLAKPHETAIPEDI